MVSGAGERWALIHVCRLSLDVCWQLRELKRVTLFAAGQAWQSSRTLALMSFSASSWAVNTLRNSLVERTGLLCVVFVCVGFISWFW